MPYEAVRMTHQESVEQFEAARRARLQRVVVEPHRPRVVSIEDIRRVWNRALDRLGIDGRG